MRKQDEESQYGSYTQIDRDLLDQENHLLHERQAPKGFEKFIKDIQKDKEAKKVTKEETKEEGGVKKEEEKPIEKEEQKSKEKQEESESEEEHPKQKQGKEEEEKSSSGFKEQITNMFSNPEPKHFGILLALVAGAYMLTKLSPTAKEKTYIEFVNDYMTKNQVKQITITKDNRSDVFNYRADVEVIDGSKFYVTLGSVDNFLAKIDMLQ